MKKSYKIIGLDWDHASTAAGFDFSSTNDDTLPLDAPNNLFDIPEKSRSVTLSKLLSFPDFASLDMFIVSACDCDELIVDIDWVPTSSGIVTWRFFALRASQTISHISRHLPGVHVTVAWTKEVEQCCRALMTS